MLALCEEGPECLSISHQQHHGGLDKGKPIAKQWLSKWLDNTIKFKYEANDLHFLIESRATRLGKLQFPMLKWLVLALKAFVKGSVGPAHALLQSSTGWTQSPTQMLSLAGEY